jgi:hypothetical protein
MHWSCQGRKEVLHHSGLGGAKGAKEDRTAAAQLGSEQLKAHKGLVRDAVDQH